MVIMAVALLLMVVRKVMIMGEAGVWQCVAVCGSVWQCLAVWA